MTEIAMIYPGTTPTLTFEFPAEINPSTCQRIRLLLTQGEEVMLQKDKDGSTSQFVISGQNVSTTLSQEETMAFRSYPTIGLELWVKTSSGSIPDPWLTSVPIGKVRQKGVF